MSGASVLAWGREGTGGEREGPLRALTGFGFMVLDRRRERGGRGKKCARSEF